MGTQPDWPVFIVVFGVIALIVAGKIQSQGAKQKAAQARKPDAYDLAKPLPPRSQYNGAPWRGRAWLTQCTYCGEVGLAETKKCGVCGGPRSPRQSQ